MRLDNFIRRCWSLWTIAAEVETDVRFLSFTWTIAAEVRTDVFRFNIFLADVREVIGLTMLTESNAIVLLRIASPKSAQGST